MPDGGLFQAIMCPQVVPLRVDVRTCASISVYDAGNRPSPRRSLIPVVCIIFLLVFHSPRSHSPCLPSSLPPAMHPSRHDPLPQSLPPPFPVLSLPPCLPMCAGVVGWQARSDSLSSGFSVSLFLFLFPLLPLCL